jgi:hypothetical protein
VVEGFFWAKAQRFCANDGDACRCRFPLGGVIVVILPALRLRVKTLDLVVSTAVALCVVTFLEASSWSPEFAWFCFFVFAVLVFLVFFSLSLICFLRGSPLHLVSVRPLVAAKACFVMVWGKKVCHTLFTRSHTFTTYYEDETSL